MAISKSSILVVDRSWRLLFFYSSIQDKVRANVHAGSKLHKTHLIVGFGLLFLCSSIQDKVSGATATTLGPILKPGERQPLLLFHLLSRSVLTRVFLLRSFAT